MSIDIGRALVVTDIPLYQRISASRGALHYLAIDEPFLYTDFFLRLENRQALAVEQAEILVVGNQGPARRIPEDILAEEGRAVTDIEQASYNFV